MTEQQMIALLKQIKADGDRANNWMEGYKAMMSGINAGLAVLEGKQ